MIKVYVDAAFKENLATGAYVLYENKTQVTQTFILNNVTNNHEAEFLVVIKTLQQLIEQQKHEQTVALFSDSIIVVKAMQRQSAKSEWQQCYLKQLTTLMSQFKLLIVDWYNEKDNQLPHQLASRQLIALQKNRKRVIQ